MKIVITGGTGLVGRYLVKILETEKPVVLSHKDCDITCFKSVREVFFSIKPEIVFHLAAFTNVDLSEKDPVSSFKINVSGTNNVVNIAGAIGAYVIYVSTDFVFSGKKKTEYSEKDFPEPVSIYGKTKLEGELIIAQQCREYCIVRTSRIFGKNGNNFASSLPAKLLKNEKILVTTDLINSPTYAKDLATALYHIFRKRFCGTIHFCNSGYCSWFEYALYICKLLKLDSSKLIPVSTKNFPNAGAPRPDFSALDTTLFNSIFYKPRFWQEALDDYIRTEVRVF